MPLILVPYLVLFFGSIALMGIAMYGVNRGLWLVTVATSAALVASMAMAMRRGGDQSLKTPSLSNFSASR